MDDLIDKLAEEWLGKRGVVAISDEEIDGKLHIVFFVNLSELHKDDYSKEINGYGVIIRKSGKIVVH